MNISQAFGEIGPIRMNRWDGIAAAICQGVEKLLEQHSLLPGERSHLFDEFCCTHPVILA